MKVSRAIAAMMDTEDKSSEFLPGLSEVKISLAFYSKTNEILCVFCHFYIFFCGRFISSSQCCHLKDATGPLKLHHQAVHSFFSRANTELNTHSPTTPPPLHHLYISGLIHKQCIFMCAIIILVIFCAITLGHYVQYFIQGSTLHLLCCSFFIIYCEFVVSLFVCVCVCLYCFKVVYSKSWSSNEA